MKKTVLILSTLFVSLIGFSQTFTEGHFSYQVQANGTDVILTTYDEVAGGTNVIIPVTATDNGTATTYAVKYIGYESFMSKGITSVVIPEGVTNIVNRAFIFNNLTSVVIPNSVVGIYGAAFGSNQISNLTLGNGLTIIEENAFNGNQLTSFDFPTGVSIIKKQVVANNLIEHVVIPSWITEIKEGAFAGNPMLTVTSFSVTAPDIFTANDLTDSFAADRSNIDLYIPAGTEGPYVTDMGALWTGFKSVSGTASIEDTDLNNNLSIYPNPVTSQFTIDTEGQVESVTILNTTGRIVETIVNATNTVDVSNLTPGVYFVQVQTENGLVSKKIIKE